MLFHAGEDLKWIFIFCQELNMFAFTEFNNFTEVTYQFTNRSCWCSFFFFLINIFLSNMFKKLLFYILTCNWKYSHAYYHVVKVNTVWIHTISRYYAYYMHMFIYCTRHTFMCYLFYSFYFYFFSYFIFLVIIFILFYSCLIYSIHTLVRSLQKWCILFISVEMTTTTKSTVVLSYRVTSHLQNAIFHYFSHHH